MPKFKVYGQVTAGKYLGEYEAETPGEAADKAQDENGSVNLCFACEKEAENAEIHAVDVENVDTGELTKNL